MNIMCVCVRMGLVLACSGILLVATACGPKRPVYVGEADITAVGMGVGRELQTLLGRGDTLLVFGMPNPIGHTDALERAVLRGLESQLQGQGVRILRVSYTDEEFTRYSEGRYTVLHPNFARTALQRYSDRPPRAVLSLMGWPDPHEPFLPRNIAFIGVSWDWPEDPAPWTRHFNEVIAVNSAHSEVFGRPSRRALRRPDDVLEWFEERFDVLAEGI